MKACRNCGLIHEDSYAGQCGDCGAPMGGVQTNGDNSLAFSYANQLAQGRRENDMETGMKRGRYDNVKLEDSVVDIARKFVVVDEEKLKELERDA